MKFYHAMLYAQFLLLYHNQSLDLTLSLTLMNCVENTQFFLDWLVNHQLNNF